MATTKTEPERLDVRAALEPFPSKFIADRLGVSVRTVERIVVNGVGYWEADVIAAKVLGTHAEFEWGAAWRNLDPDDKPAFRLPRKPR
jgi:FixJ family two-component response regulator